MLAESEFSSPPLLAALSPAIMASWKLSFGPALPIDTCGQGPSSPVMTPEKSSPEKDIN